MNDIKLILQSLHVKFGSNIDLSLEEKSLVMEEIEVKARAIFYFKKVICSKPDITTTQIHIAQIFEEIFADITICLYLGCCSIDNPARILLRRILELGLATVYLWDLPHKFWSWNGTVDEHTNDLNFKEMLEHVNGKGYIEFINNENSSSLLSLLDKEEPNKIYRSLSNVIHGKVSSFETTAIDSYNFNKVQHGATLEYILRVENLLLALWKKRFPAEFFELEGTFTTLTRYHYEQ